jgi:hypothetical protein
MLVSVLDAEPMRSLLNSLEPRTERRRRLCESIYGLSYVRNLMATTLVAVEKLRFPQKRGILGDRKCLGKPRKSFVGHPDAKLFLRISREGVFQQPL